MRDVHFCYNNHIQRETRKVKEYCYSINFSVDDVDINLSLKIF